MSRGRAIALLALLASAASCSFQASPVVRPAPIRAGERTPRTVVYVVRHAEAEQDGTRDPALSAAGMERAEALHERMRFASIAAVYASPYRRTQQTAERLAAALDLEVRAYDPADPEALVERILYDHLGRHVLVVGHSNTVPLVVAALGAERPPDLAHAEHDALFEIRVSGEDVVVLRSRYGARSDTTTAR